MRLTVVERGHRGRARFYVWLMGRLAGRTPDVVKTLMYRPEFFGRTASQAVHAVMRGTSPWEVRDRELFAAYTSSLNRCSF